MSYHQGITWPWLLGIYTDAFKKIKEAQKPGKKKQELEANWKTYINGIETTFGSDENTCFVADNEGIYDYTLKLDYKYQSEEKADKISEIISHAKNYYPKAFKAKCAKQRERDLKAGTFKC